MLGVYYILLPTFCVLEILYFEKNKKNPPKTKNCYVIQTFFLTYKIG